MSARLALIEPYAHRPGGHHHGTLAALARAHGNAVVVVPCGVTLETAQALRSSGAILCVGRGGLLVGVLRCAAGAAERAAVLVGSAVARRRGRVRRVPHQFRLLARSLTEAACVRTARRITGPLSVVVVLTASEALHGLAGLLGGPHVRFVHEVVTTEDRAVRLLGRIARRGARRVRCLAPTAAVRADLAGRFPDLDCRVRPFAVADPQDRISARERERARDVFSLAGHDVAVCLVGGWWGHKDLRTVDAALARLTSPLHVIVAGHPVDTDVLERWAVLPMVGLHIVRGPVSAEDLRLVYAASDAGLVARLPGVGKESGLVVDSIRLGVPLIVSEHDPTLTAALHGREWVRSFPAQDPGALAGVLLSLSSSPLRRPPFDAGAELGVPTAAVQVAAFLDLREYT